MTKTYTVRLTDADGITIVASAMHILANTIKKIDDIRVEGLVKGLTTIAVVLAEVTVFSKLAKGSGMISAGAGLTIMAAAIKIMVPPLKELGEMRRSEEHTSELQSRFDLVCRLLLEKKKATTRTAPCV